MTNLTLQQTFQERVVEKIKASFVEMIPEEAFAKMTAQCMDQYENGPVEKRYTIQQQHVGVGQPGADEWGRISTQVVKLNRDGHPEYNPINDPETMIGTLMAMVKEDGKKRLTAILDSDEYKNIWVNQQGVAAKVLQDMVKDNADIFVQQMFSGIVSNMMLTIRSQMNNGIRY